MEINKNRCVEKLKKISSDDLSWLRSQVNKEYEDRHFKELRQRSLIGVNEGSSSWCNSFSQGDWPDDML